MLTYAGIPSQLAAPVITVTTGNLTTAVTGSLYWQMRNRQGFNLYSPPAAVNLTTGQDPICKTEEGTTLTLGLWDNRSVQVEIRDDTNAANNTGDNNQGETPREDRNASIIVLGGVLSATVPNRRN